jgi:mannose-6-phosphate isomerase-like protein (cupin superfamily)
MAEMTRRNLCFVLPAFALLGKALAQSSPTSTSEPSLTHSRVFAFDQLPVNKGAGGNASRHVLRGTLPTGEVVEIHETTLMPGLMPHPPHKHVHEEFLMIREGTLEFTANDKAEKVGPGGIVYTASGEVHSLKNVGNTSASYFVIAIGAELGKG